MSYKFRKLREISLQCDWLQHQFEIYADSMNEILAMSKQWQHRALSTHHSFVTLGVTAGSLLFLLLALDHSGTLRILRTLGVPRSQTLPPPLVRHFLGRYLNWNRRESAGGRAAWDNFLGAVWCGHARSIGRTQSKRGNSPTEVVFFPTHVIVTYIRIESFNLTDIAAFLVFLGYSQKNRV